MSVTLPARCPDHEWDGSAWLVSHQIFGPAGRTTSAQHELLHAGSSVSVLQVISKAASLVLSRARDMRSTT